MVLLCFQREAFNIRELYQSYITVKGKGELVHLYYHALLYNLAKEITSYPSLQFISHLPQCKSRVALCRWCN